MRNSTLKQRTPLKAKTPLKKTPLKRVSKKQAKENALWSKIKSERKDKLFAKFWYLPCEQCQQSIISSEAEGHHNDHNRRNNTPQNCRIICHNCNCFVVEDNNIKDVPDLLNADLPT